MQRYDLIIVDHPFVGFAAAHDVLVDLSSWLVEADKKRFAEDSVGPSWDSYWYRGGLWAFPIDAAAQVASYRPDLLSQLSSDPPRTLASLTQLARNARRAGKFIIVPACPTDAISLFFTVTSSIDHPILEDADPFVEPAVGRAVLQLLHDLIAVAHPRSVEWNPIQVYDFMVASSEAIYCPYAFGYSNYSREGLPTKLKFTTAPAAGQRGCAGTMLGGTGVAVSSASPYREHAIAYAKWLVSKQHQAGRYFQEGGQPASLAAWTDPEVNAASNDFFRDTLPTLESAYVRPRFDGFVRFFECAGIEINRCLRGQRTDEQLIGWLNDHYAASRSAIQQVRARSTA
jgi:multiple sugar transport system substrate-binding protein